MKDRPPPPPPPPHSRPSGPTQLEDPRQGEEEEESNEDLEEPGQHSGSADLPEEGDSVVREVSSSDMANDDVANVGQQQREDECLRDLQL